MTPAPAIRVGARAVLALFYAGAGIAHLMWPAPFLLIIPAGVPYPDAVVLVTGLLEIAGAIGLLVRRWRRVAGLMLAIYAVCVFPANIRHALSAHTGVVGVVGWRLVRTCCKESGHPRLPPLTTPCCKPQIRLSCRSPYATHRCRPDGSHRPDQDQG
jgi:uncharacterized membrane protein